jgi:hypothetical protein
MAKKSSPVFYCGFCDMTLAKSEGVVYDTVHYCGELCCKLGKKTNVKDASMEKMRKDVNSLRQGESKTRIKQHAKGAYEDLTSKYKKWLLVNNPEDDLTIYKLYLCVYGHIHNGHKDKALKALARFNDWTAEKFEEMCVNPAEYCTQVEYDDGSENITGEENLRVTGVLYKLQREKFKLMIDQM